MSCVYNQSLNFVLVQVDSKLTTREGEAPYADCGLDKNQRNCIDYVLSTDPAKLFIPKEHLALYKLHIL